MLSIDESDLYQDTPRGHQLFVVTPRGPALYYMYIYSIQPGKSTWNLKMDFWKTIFLYNPVVVRFVKFPVCIWSLFNRGSR